MLSGFKFKGGHRNIKKGYISRIISLAPILLSERLHPHGFSVTIETVDSCVVEDHSHQDMNADYPSLIHDVHPIRSYFGEILKVQSSLHKSHRSKIHVTITKLQDLLPAIDEI